MRHKTGGDCDCYYCELGRRKPMCYFCIKNGENKLKIVTDMEHAENISKKVYLCDDCYDKMIPIQDAEYFQLFKKEFTLK